MSDNLLYQVMPYGISVGARHQNVIAQTGCLESFGTFLADGAYTN